MPCSLPSRITKKVLKNWRLFLQDRDQDQMFKTKTKTSWSKTKIFIFVLEAPRDQDPGLEDYITGFHFTLHHVRCAVRLYCSLSWLTTLLSASYKVHDVPCKPLQRSSKSPRISYSEYSRHPVVGLLYYRWPNCKIFVANKCCIMYVCIYLHSVHTQKMQAKCFLQQLHKLGPTNRFPWNLTRSFSNQCFQCGVKFPLHLKYVCTLPYKVMRVKIVTEIV